MMVITRSEPAPVSHAIRHVPSAQVVRKTSALNVDQAISRLEQRVLLIAAYMANCTETRPTIFSETCIVTHATMHAHNVQDL
jgi:hypothetical protein